MSESVTETKMNTSPYRPPSPVARDMLLYCPEWYSATRSDSQEYKEINDVFSENKYMIEDPIKDIGRW